MEIGDSRLDHWGKEEVPREKCEVRSGKRERLPIED
jgi:hypothetical protein